MSTPLSSIYSQQEIQEIAKGLVKAYIQDRYGIATLREGLGLSIELLQPLYNLGRAAFLQGNYTFAMYRFAELFLLDEKEFAYSYALAKTLAELKEYQKAILFFGKAYHNDYTNPLPLINIAELLIKLGEPKEAITYLKESLIIIEQFCPDNPIKLEALSLLDKLDKGV